MYSKQFFFKNNTKFKLVNLKLNANAHLSGYKEMVHVYNGLKNFYTFENSKKALKFDSKVGLYVLDCYRKSPLLNSFYYSSFFFPKNSMKSRYIYSFFYKNYSLRMHSFVRLTRRLNRLLVVGLIKKINIINLKSKFLLRNYVLGRKGNYNSGFVLTSFGLSGLFLRFSLIWFKPFVFIPKKVFYRAKALKVEKSFFRLIKNTFNRLLFYYEYLSQLKIKSNLSILFIFKRIFREFISLKFLFRLFFVSRKKVIFTRFNKYKFKMVSKLLKICYPIYRRFILKSYRQVFYSLLYFFRSKNFLLNASFTYLFSSMPVVNNHNLFLNKRISMGLLTNFVSRYVKRNFAFKSRKRIMKKVFNFYKYFLESHNKLLKALFLNNEKQSFGFKINYFFNNSINYPVDKIFNDQYIYYKKKIFSIYNYKRLFSGNVLMSNKNFYLNKRRKKIKLSFYRDFGKTDGYIVHRLFDIKYKQTKKKLNLLKIKRKRSYLLKLFKRTKRRPKKSKFKFKFKRKKRTFSRYKSYIFYDKKLKKKVKRYRYFSYFDKQLGKRVKKKKTYKRIRYISEKKRFSLRKKRKLTIFRKYYISYKNFYYKRIFRSKKKIRRMIYRFNLHHLKAVDMTFLFERIRTNKDSYYNEQIILNKIVERYMEIFPSGRIFLNYEHLTYDQLFDYYAKFDYFRPYDKVGFYIPELNDMITFHVFNEFYSEYV